MRKFIFILFLCLTSIVQGQILSSVNVFAEKEDEDFIKCNLSSAGYIAAAESSLRYNRIRVQVQNESEVYLYLNVNVLPIRRGGTETGSCAASLEIQFYKVGMITLARGTLFGDHTLCKKAALFIFDIQNLQTRINEQVRSYTEQCISDIEKKGRR
jgi:hypothetical protein